MGFQLEGVVETGICLEADNILPSWISSAHRFRWSTTGSWDVRRTTYFERTLDDIYDTAVRLSPSPAIIYLVLKRNGWLRQRQAIVKAGKNFLPF